MRIDVVTLFPEMVVGGCSFGVTGRAIDRGLLDLQTWNPRDYTTDRHRTVDDRPYGGGPGMVMKYEPLHDAIGAARGSNGEQPHTILMSPQGRQLDQNGVLELLQRPRLILVAGRYEGIDERVVETEIDEEWSIGDYVLSGGEFAAMVMIDALTRMLPGALGDAESAQQDSFMDGLLDCPHYTRPEQMAGMDVPAVLMSGDHAAIRRWRLKQSLGRTWLRRPDLLQDVALDKERRQLLDEFMSEHGKVSG
ncbi:tRNA (guanosine(37)-N1)-methyltransferase TrmD [Solemya pervernicosa gill symbiont]|uniref:tRNA (guanine-N(1)-)-methyltransferase n=2 Tax=Gammaproteobacteria incertae sedis TaxID=118884 RepID=A0A1T2L7Q5_9GAMM|nr:tRNA (guanosine(37)-N1)-methyltransferase TrmD [Candidatus Reidiella endopervernicosa]OOZ41113.1 tRNA (guanosine(37)-N1)-methyltransferase TrmD [Solemya pervernicosa gill symbiont]QKQ26277.1 tRNA (guanosine(37)-N1)-methyltransferase TrmD [Candidatus Reidiella endopervernicosa]